MNMVESMQIDNLSVDEVSITANEGVEHNIITGSVPIELGYYIQNYQGSIYYMRLFFIASHVPQLKSQALRLAHDYIKEKTMNVIMYNHVFELLAAEVQPNFKSDFNSLLGGDDENHHRLDGSAPNSFLEEISSGKNSLGLMYDHAWVDRTRRKYTVQIEQLDTDLKNFKANAIKESIRRGSDELGDLYLLNGELHNAYRCYTRSRDYCTSPFQELIMCLNVIKVAIYQNSWATVSSHVNKAECLNDIRDPSTPMNENTAPNLVPLTPGTQSAEARSTTGLSFKDAVAQARTLLALAGGLCEMAMGRYRSAVNYFLQVNYDNLEQPALFATATDTAFYMTLCALATMDRVTLSTQILGPSNVNARLLLEVEPTCREIIHSFQSADYSTCLRELAKVETQLRMDMFLSSHVSHLFHEIRCKALCQYFSPYQSARLDKMALSFGTSRAELEVELANLIQKGSIKARIDSHRGLLKALNVDQRSICFSQAMKSADDYLKRTQTMLLRLSLARLRLAVQPDKNDPQIERAMRSQLTDGNNFDSFLAQERLMMMPGASTLGMTLSSLQQQERSNNVI